MTQVAAIVLVVVAAAVVALAPAAAELTQVEHLPKAEGLLNILAVGDWGRRGQYNQTLVAQQVMCKTFTLFSLQSKLFEIVQS
jgi:tartrate-resistant acid phosphatase type 5